MGGVASCKMSSCWSLGLPLIATAMPSLSPNERKELDSSSWGVRVVSSRPGLSSAGGGGGGGGGGVGAVSVLLFFGEPGVSSPSLFLLRYDSAGDISQDLDFSVSLRVIISSAARGVSGVSVSVVLVTASSFALLPARAAFPFSRSIFFFKALSIKSFTKILTAFSCFEPIGALGSFTRPDLKSPRTSFLAT